MNPRLVAPGLFLALILGILPAPGQKATTNSTATLKVGDAAPDFTLLDQDRKKVSLADFRGKKNVVLAFYVLAFTGG